MIVLSSIWQASSEISGDGFYGSYELKLDCLLADGVGGFNNKPKPSS